MTASLIRYVLSPVDLPALAALFERRAGHAAILSGNDVTWLLHRSQWGMLSRLRPGRLRCYPRCDGRSTPVIRKLWKEYNEYCLMASAFAEAGLMHIEVSHPVEEGLRLALIDPLDPAADAFRQLHASRWRLVRFDGEQMWAPRRMHIPGLADAMRAFDAAVQPEHEVLVLEALVPGASAGAGTSPLQAASTSSLPPHRTTNNDSVAATSLLGPDEIYAEIEALRALELNTLAPQAGARVANRLRALEWYVHSTLLSGVVCRRRTSPAAAAGCAAVTATAGGGGLLGPIECTACSNGRPFEHEATEGHRREAVLGKKLYQWQQRAWGFEALASAGSTTSKRSGRSAPPPFHLPPACPRQVDLFWVGGGAGTGYPLDGTVTEQSEQRRQRVTALRALRLGALATAEEECHVLESDEERSRGRQLSPTTPTTTPEAAAAAAAASSMACSAESELGGGCDALVALYSLKDGAGNSAACFGEEPLRRLRDETLILRNQRFAVRRTTSPQNTESGAAAFGGCS